MRTLLVASCLVTAFVMAPDPLDRIAEDYVKLVLAVGQHDADYVDAYYGPPEWKKDVAAKKAGLDEIAAAAAELTSGLTRQPQPDDEMTRFRLQYLRRQLAALSTRVRMLEGEKLSFDDESQALYDAVAPTLPESQFQEILDRLEARFPGSGPLVQRYDAFRAAFVIPRAKLDAVFQRAIDACREKTRAHVTLPEGERFTVEYVTNKSWSGYNWYQGGFKSVIQVNTDLPIYIDRAIDLACHEGYPGHHVYNVLLEKKLEGSRLEGVHHLSALLAAVPDRRRDGEFRHRSRLPREGTGRLRTPRALPARGTGSGARGGILRGAGAGRSARVRGERGGAALYRQADRRRPGRRVAGALRADAARPCNAARALLRSIPKLRDQLQPREGHGAALYRIAWRHGGPAGEALGRVRAAALLTATSFRSEMR